MKSLLIKDGRILTDEKFITADMLIEDGTIKKIGCSIEADSSMTVYNANGNMVLPGFIDIHTHGGAGYDMNNVTVQDMEEVCRFFASCGTTGFLPTVLSDSKEQLIKCVEVLAKAKETVDSGAQILGIHMEGPYLCKDYKGAMPEHLLALPSVSDFMEYQKAAKGSIKSMTVSPEVADIPEFIKEISKTGVVMSIGHSGADYDTAMKCIENGATNATHTFNAMKLPHQHFPAISGAVLESDIFCEAICDGRHLHPGIVRLLLKTKGMDRVIAVTDSIMAAGLPDGKYKLGVNDIVVTDGDAMLADGSSRAGSTLTTIQAFRNIIKFTGKVPEEVSCLLSANPAKLLGIHDKKGTISEGKDADLIVLDKDYNLISTIIKGKTVYSSR